MSKGGTQGTKSLPFALAHPKTSVREGLVRSGTQNLQRLIRMPLHVEFTFHDAQDPPVGSNHKGRTLAGQRTEPFYSKKLGDFTCRV